MIPTHIKQISRSLRTQSSLTKAFYALLAAIALLLISKGSSASSDMFACQFHLNSSSYTKWMALQPVPAMYSFSNESWYTPFPYEKETMDFIEEGGMDDDEYTEHFHINHYPVRLLTFRLNRSRFTDEEEKIQAFYVRSKYQGRYRLTAYEMRIDGEHMTIKIIESREGYLSEAIVDE